MTDENVKALALCQDAEDSIASARAGGYQGGDDGEEMAKHVRRLVDENERLRAGLSVAVVSLQAPDPAEAERDALRARVAALEAALRPFAAIYERFRIAYREKMDREPRPGAESGLLTSDKILPDCRRAAELLADTPTPKES